MPSLSLLAASLSLVFLPINAQIGKNGFNSIAVYWGQNSYGQGSGGLEQKNLSTYCADTNIDIIPMAFLYQLTTGTGGEPVINFANQGDPCTTFDGTGLLNCPDMGKDITTCQQKYNKTILLSVGGATYTEGGFTSMEAAKAAANTIWQTFGPPSTNTSALRPFGNASVDGFDFDFESTVSNMVTFGQTLRSLMDVETTNQRRDVQTTAMPKQYYLTAAPQCVYPDAADNEMLNGTVPFDAVFVQFYNNYCGVQSFTPNATTQNNFNFDVWDTWAKTLSKNSDVKVYVGVPAGQTAAGSGYTPADSLKAVLEYCQTFPSFGGVMMWDASQAYANDGFLPGVKSALTAGKRRRSRAVEFRA